MPHPSASCGLTELEMPICARLGYAPATTWLEISQSYWLRSVYLARYRLVGHNRSLDHGGLALQGAALVIRHSLEELREPSTAAA